MTIIVHVSFNILAMM